VPAIRLKPIVLALALLASVASAARAAENETIVLRFENHHFTPTQLSVAAGKPLVIQVENASAETIEFESFKLNREKSIAPGHKVTIRLPALQPASYDFYDDFHQDVPEGTIVAK
jgi:cupredoxin-like protein